MEQPNLNLLILTQAELSEARRQVEEMAYFKWLNAGCPEGDDSLRFWNDAELEWIEYYYVPDRDCEAESPPATSG